MAFFEEACIPMGCRKVFTDRRVFMFSNTLMRVSSCQADVIWKTMIHRAYALSSMTEAFDQECTRLRSIFTRPDYPLAMINSSITKTIQSFSFGMREKNKEDSSVVRVSLPFKDETSAIAAKRQMGDLSQDCHYTTTCVYQRKIVRRPQAQRNQPYNRKSTMRCLLFCMWSVWFRLRRLYSSTPSSTYCWT